MKRILTIIFPLLMTWLSQEISAHVHAGDTHVKTAISGQVVPADEHHEDSPTHQTFKRPVRGCRFGFMDQYHNNPWSKFRTQDGPTPQQSRYMYRSKHPSSHGEGVSSPRGTGWLVPLTAAAFISMAPVGVIYFMPNYFFAEHSLMLKVGLSFASGAMLGDAFLHLIPHSMFADDHGHSHDSEGVDYVTVFYKLFLVVFGIFLCFVVDKLIRCYWGPGSHDHHHAHYPLDAPDLVAGQRRNHPGIMAAEGIRHRIGNKDNRDSNVNAGGDSPRRLIPLHESLPLHSPPLASVQPEYKVAGYLYLGADFVHKFADGLAIGASFLASEGVGLMTLFPVLCHELPHSMGDYAILIQSGWSRNKALLMMLLTATGTVIGTLVSLGAEGVGQLTTAWIMPITAGGFIYISVLSVIPDPLENSTAWQSVFEILALAAGVGMMYFLTHFE